MLGFFRRRRVLIGVVVVIAALGGLFVYGRRRVEQMGGFPDVVAARGEKPQWNDFNVYWEAAAVLEAPDLYGRDFTPDGRRYLYPPFLAAALRPLRPLGVTGGAIVWFLASVLGALVGVAASVRLAIAPSGSPEDPGSRRMAIAALVAGLMLAGRFIFDDLGNGNVNSIVFAVCALGGLAFARGRGVTGALLFAVATAVKLTPAFVLVWLVARRAARETAVFVLAVAALVVGIPALVVGPTRALELPGEMVGQALERESRSAEAAPVNGSSLRAAIHRWFVAPSEPPPADRPAIRLGSIDADAADRIWRIGAVALALAFAACFAWRAPRGFAVAHARRTAVDLACVAIAAALLSPVTRKAHLVALIVAGTVLGRRAFGDRRAPDASTRRSRVILFTVVALFWLADRSLVGRRLAEWAWATNMLFFATVLLAIGLLAIGLSAVGSATVRPRDDVLPGR